MTKAETMVERVARAIEAAADYDEGRYLCGWSDTFARAAIEAMREPTKAMNRAAYEDAKKRAPAPAFIWAAMISAALSETPEDTEGKSPARTSAPNP